MKKYTDKMDSAGQWEPVFGPHIPTSSPPRPKARGCPKCGEAMKPAESEKLPFALGQETQVCTACGWVVEMELQIEPDEPE